MQRHYIDPEGTPFAPSSLERKDQIDFDTLVSVDVRVGRVLDAEPFPEARDPALRITVDFGPVVGVMHSSAKITNYDPAALIGRRVVGVVNLPPKRIAGFVSEFLVLGALEPDGTVGLLAVEGDSAPGAPVA